MGAAHRIVLRFEEAWWPRAGEPLSFAHGPASAFPVWWASAPGDQPRLTGWCGGPRAFSLAGRTPAVLVQAAFDSLAVIFGAHARNEADRLKGVYYHDWVTDPYSLGAYSYGGVGGPEARAFLAEPVSDTLYLAGEAMAPHGRNATVHGAIASGVHAAEAAVRMNGRAGNRKRGRGVSSSIRLTFPAVGTPMGSAAEVRVPVKRHHGVVRLAHWLNAIVLARHDRQRAPDIRSVQPFRIWGGLFPLPNPLDGTAIPGWGRLGGWLAGGLNWHFALAWPFVITCLVYLFFLSRPASGARCSSGHADVPAAVQMHSTTKLRKDHRAQGKHNALEKGAYTFIVLLGALRPLPDSPSTSRSSSPGSRHFSATTSATWSIVKPTNSHAAHEMPVAGELVAAEE